MASEILSQDERAWGLNLERGLRIHDAGESQTDCVVCGARAGCPHVPQYQRAPGQTPTMEDIRHDALQVFHYGERSAGPVYAHKPTTEMTAEDVAKSAALNGLRLPGGVERDLGERSGVDGYSSLAPDITAAQAADWDRLQRVRLRSPGDCLGRAGYVSTLRTPRLPINAALDELVALRQSLVDTGRSGVCARQAEALRIAIEAVRGVAGAMREMEGGK